MKLFRKTQQILTLIMLTLTFSLNVNAMFSALSRCSEGFCQNLIKISNPCMSRGFMTLNKWLESGVAISNCSPERDQKALNILNKSLTPHGVKIEKTDTGILLPRSLNGEEFPEDGDTAGALLKELSLSEMPIDIVVFEDSDPSYLHQLGNSTGKSKDGGGHLIFLKNDGKHLGLKFLHEAGHVYADVSGEGKARGVDLILVPNDQLNREDQARLMDLGITEQEAERILLNTEAAFEYFRDPETSQEINIAILESYHSENVPREEIFNIGDLQSLSGDSGNRRFTENKFGFQAYGDEYKKRQSYSFFD